MEEKKTLKYLEEPERSVYIAEIITLAAITVLSIILTLIRDNVSIFEDILTCKFRQVTGIPCPSCGGTRAVLQLLHGHILASLYFHATATYISILCIVFFISQTMRQLSRGKLAAVKWHSWYWKIGIIIYICQYIMKLAIPGYTI